MAASNNVIISSFHSNYMDTTKEVVYVKRKYVFKSVYIYAEKERQQLLKILSF